MAWRKKRLLLLGPGLLGGISFGDWWALLRANRFAVDPAYWLRAGMITLNSLRNSQIRRREEAAYGKQVAETEVEPPLFVLGIWRSGTTHLQNLLAVDDRFAFPNWYQMAYPHTFLETETTSGALGARFLPETRLQDNMKLGFALPAEEEFALGTLTTYSATMSWVFPRRAAHYDRYLTFKDVLASEREEWKAAFLWLVQKLTWKYCKPLVLKSPPHTARIALLLELFPLAKFVHIHRDPYAVFPSACHTARAVMRYAALQHPRLDIEARAIRDYKAVFDAFFEQKPLIAPGRFHEIAFDDLEHDPIGQMRTLYEVLALPDFRYVEPAMRAYVSSVSDYRKNVYPALDPATRARLAQEWQRCFAAWGYSADRG